MGKGRSAVGRFWGKKVWPEGFSSSAVHEVFSSIFEIQLIQKCSPRGEEELWVKNTVAMNQKMAEELLNF